MDTDTKLASLSLTGGFDKDTTGHAGIGSTLGRVLKFNKLASRLSDVCGLCLPMIQVLLRPPSRLNPRHGYERRRSASLFNSIHLTRLCIQVNQVADGEVTA